ncbi:MAG: hypothetical protein D6805_08020 [Planctomycetota bacterium]|nr:MAG: hypothetical protein D6805_08020 [Planctomycetota bacterium]
MKAAKALKTAPPTRRNGMKIDPNSPQNHCQNWDCLNEYLDGELPPKEKEKLEQHLKKCSHCQREFFLLKQMWNALGELEEIQPSSDFFQRLRHRTQPPLPRRWSKWKALAASVIFLCAAGLVIHWRKQPSPPPHSNGPLAKAKLPSPVQQSAFTKEEKELLQHWQLLENYFLLEKQEFLENLELVDQAIPEEILLDVWAGKKEH